MTIQIRSRQTIAGLPAFEARRFFRHVKAWHANAFGKKWVMKYLKLHDRKATEVIRSLIREGYVVRSGKRDDETAFEFTDLGSSLVRASGAKKITRTMAAEALQAFMARVKAVNETPRFLYTVNAVVVFGSYLKNVGELGDLDLAVQLKSRIADAEQRVTRELEHAGSSGRSFSRFIDQLTWAHDEVMLALKARKRTISVQPWSSFIAMEKDTGFKYRVLLGDAESIRAELAELEGMNMEQGKQGKGRRR
jgi:predicted nucleotidyltransferase/predicted transcriptional regulator